MFLAAGAGGLLRDMAFLCETNAGLSAVVGPLCALIRAYAEVQSVAFFWVDADGRPVGFYHDRAPAELKDLFITRFDELFTGPDEINMLVLLHNRGEPIGRYLQVGEQERIRRSNIQRYLCAPLGDRYAMDIRVDSGGVGRVLCLVWRGEERPFGPGDILRARSLQHALERLIANERDDARWIPVLGGTGEFVTDASGERLLAIDPAADRLLMNSHLLNQRLSMSRPPQAPPAFARTLAADAAAGGGRAETVLPVPAGRLVARARIGRKPEDGAPILLISLALEAAYDVLCIQHVVRADLTPMQQRVALYGMQGGKRADCIAALGTTAEAMKKHCAAVFDALGVGAWGELHELGERLAAAHAV